MTTKKYVIIKTYNFDPEIEVVEFTDFREATAYLHWVWETCYNEAIANDEDLAEEWCYHESDYARVEWRGGDIMKFELVEVSPKRIDFPTDWERYVCEFNYGNAL